MSIGLSIGLYFITRNSINTDYILNEQNNIDHIFQNLNLTFTNILNINLVVIAYLNLEPNITLIKFNSFFNKTNINYKDNVFFVYNPIIKNEAKTDFLNFTKEIYDNNYNIRNFNGQINNITQDFYFPVLYTYTPSPNILGYDSFAEPSRKKLVLQAIQTGKTQVSDPITIVRSSGYGFLLLSPLYNNFYNQNAIIFISIDLKNLLPILLNNENIYDLYIYDSLDTSKIFFSNNNSSDTLFTEGINVFYKELNIFNNIWYVKFVIKRYPQLYFAYIVMLIVIIVLGLIILIVFFTLRYNENKQRVKKENAKRLLNIIGYVNHEIRNPLQSIQGNTEIALLDLEDLTSDDSQLKQVIIDNLNKSNYSCDLLKHIVDDILDISAILENRFILKKSEIQLVSFVERIMNIMRTKIEEVPNVKITYEIKVKSIFTDPYRLMQVFLNIFSNALKFTSQGFIQIEISKVKDLHIQISPTFKEDYQHVLNNTIFVISDTGKGIKEENFKNIFFPYEQTTGIDYIRTGSVAMGLYLCKLFMDKMEGKIGFESKVGKGSIFWFILPYKSELV